MSNSLLTLFPFLIVFIASLYKSADLDLGWHLKYGEHFVHPPTGEQRVLRVNSLSSEMTDYRYPNTSWASDVLLYTIFQKFNFFGITILGATIITLTFYFWTRAASLTLFQQSIIFPLLIYLLAPQNAAGYRAQLFSFLFLGTLFYLLNPSKKSSMFRIGQLSVVKCQLLLIPLFLVWANMHGEYLTGLVLLGVYIAIRLLNFTRVAILKNMTKRAQYDIRTTRKVMASGGLREVEKIDSNFKKRLTERFFRMADRVKYEMSLVLIFIFSILATLINPFGINIHLESLRHFANPLQKYVIEWLPPETFSNIWWNLVVVGTASIISFLLLLKNRHLSLVTFLLLALSFWSRRYAWNFFYLSIFLIAPLIAKIEPRDRHIKFIATATMLFIFFIVSLSSKIPFSQFKNASWESYCTEVGCSPNAAKYLVENNLGQNLYTLYDWGGWLMFNFPIKPSMDGRKALWRDKNGYSAFEKYYALQQNSQDIDKSEYKTVLISPRKPLYFRLNELTKENEWRLVFQDQVASIFVRN